MIPADLKATDRWKLRSKTLHVGRIPLLMGIVNVTPDSFSDGGKYLDPDKAVAHGLKLACAGADILDVGGQSTRPGARRASVREELDRVMPVVSALGRISPVPISIDTFEPGVAEEALIAGVEAINDITALADPEMLSLAVSSGCGVCAMHMQGVPQTMQVNPLYEDVVAEVLEFLRQRRDALTAAGIEPARIALDPGIGFGKTKEHNLALLCNAWRFHALDCPVLIGHSRKGFIGQMAGSINVRPAVQQNVEGEVQQKVGASVEQNVEAAVQLPPQPPAQLPAQPSEFDPLPGTIGAALALARQGVQILRVHDVEAVRNALLMFEACGGF
ncbi:MAG: dihydropteroate synthase [Thermoguttaceae bacterium]